MKNQKINKKCLICGTAFISWPCREKKYKNGKRFCSNKCYGKWRSQNLYGKKHYSWNGGKKKLKCAQCGRLFYKWPSDLEHRKHKCCSKKCDNKWRSIHERGPASKRWQGGITPIHFQIRASPKYFEWRLRVFKRDKFKCTKCGMSGSILEAHHKKKTFSVLLHEVIDKFPKAKLYDAAMEYKPLWDIRYGITLCKKCHRALGKSGSKKLSLEAKVGTKYN